MKTIITLLIVLFPIIGCNVASSKTGTKKIKEFGPEYKKTGSDLKAFLRDISYVESKGNHKIISKHRMLGKYQFKWSTARQHLKKWKLNRVSQKQFLNRPSLQDSVMMANMKMNEEILKEYIKKYDNKTVFGVKITRAGILAGAQFGPGTVMEFFDRKGKYSLKDGNGVHVGYYMKRFSKYKLPKKIKI